MERVEVLGSSPLHELTDRCRRTTLHSQENGVAITVFKNNFVQFIPPDGTHYFALGPSDLFGSGSINVTAHSTDNVSLQPNFVEVIQMATRRSARFGGGHDFWLDIVVRNNAHVGGPGAGFNQWVVYTSVITP